MGFSEGEGRPFPTLDHVYLRLQDRIVFENTRWEILQGQQWAVLGPTGSGKSVLVKALLGEIPVVRGQIHYHFLEKDQNQEASESFQRLRSRVACVCPDSGKAFPGQGSGFYQLRWNSFLNTDSPLVSETIFPRQAGSTNPRRSTGEQANPAGPSSTGRDLIRLLGVEPLLNRRLSVLSDGELRRVMMAEALLRGPRLLVLENPFTGLDSSYRVKLRSIIDKVMKRQTVVILVTTRAEEIPESTTHVLRVDRNRVVAQGPKKDVLQAYSPDGTSNPGVTHHRSEEGKNRPAGPLLLELRKVHVSYNGIHILNGVTWEVRRGEHWALLGPNGAGKTTLLSLILGDNPQVYANHVALFGRRRGSGETIWDIKSRIGWVAPELHLHYPRRFTCLEVVCSGYFDSVGLFRRVTPDQRRSAESLLRELGMGDRLERPFGSISQGEQRMTLLARALVKRPPLLLLDEPCQGLDAEHRRWLIETVDVLGRQGETTILYVTHEQDELPRVLTHVLLLRKGKVARKGPIEEVL
ncbi:MAG: ATP-binding cassette domain-containing protein [Thermodesulfobacteriota bacterium]